MALLKQIFNFYINSSIHVALSVYSLTWITLLTFNLNYSEPVLYFVFYATISGYNFVKYFGIAKFKHKPLKNWLKLIQILSFFSFILMCYYAIQLKLYTHLLIGCFTVLTVLYAIPFLSKKNNSLRNIRGLKVYIIALVWAGVTVIVPLINIDFEFNFDVVILAVQRFLYVVVLMIPFEIRDLKYDSIELSTIPQKFGVKKSKLLGVVVLLVFFFLEFFKDETRLETIIVLLTITLCTAVLIKFSKVDQNKYYASFLVEGLPILWLVLALFFN